MRKILPVLAIFLAALFLSVSAFAAAKKTSTQAYLENLHNQGKERVIVSFNGKPDKTTIAKYNAKLIRELKIINALVCEIDSSAIESLKQNPNIKSVTPDILIKIPQPDRVKVQPQKLAILSYEGTALPTWENLEAGLNAKAAWDRYNLDGTGIKVAFLDTGINYGNDPAWPLPDLDGNYLGGYDFVDNDSDPMPFIHPTDPDLSEWHGTGIAAECLGEGESKVVGMAYNASYYALRVIGSDGTGEVSNCIAALEWCLDPDGNPETTDDKPDIINMSLRIYDMPQNPFWPYVKAEYEAACNAAYDAGIILVAASGNDGYSYSAYPAAFENVISVGGHAEDQTLYNTLGGSSNGGVDIIAPGEYTPCLSPENILYHGSGTSGSAACASGLIALQLQYTRQHYIQPNNGYLWEVMKHSAYPLTGEPYDPVWQGKGKIYAARTDVNDANVGSIDLIASDWPIDYAFGFTDYAFTDNNLPVYQIGSDVNQTITLTNLTGILGNTIETIENLKVTATQVYCGEPNEPNLPGNSVRVFPTITALEPNEANSITLSYVYSIPAETSPGLKKTKLEFEFNFVGNSRVIKVSYNEPNSFWYAAIPADLDISYTVVFFDYSIFARQWQQSGCHQPDWCIRADINRDGIVDWSDLDILADHWLDFAAP